VKSTIARPAQSARRKQPTPIDALRRRNRVTAGRAIDGEIMPFTTPLRDIPAPPDPQSAWVDKDGRPTVALFDFIRKLLASEETQKAALDELEP
jgi:hypothetical protein